MPDSTEAKEFEKNNPELILLRSYEEPVYGITTEVFFNLTDNHYYAKGFFGAGKGDLRSFVKIDDDPTKRAEFIKNLSKNLGNGGGKEIIHRTDY